MIVPSNRLLLFLALVGIPLFTLLGMQNIPGSAIVVAAVLLLLALALDAPIALASIRAIRVLLPEMTRTSKGRELEIEAVVENPGQLCRVLRLGLRFNF